MGKVPKELFSGSPKHNERILDAFIVEKDVVFAKEDKQFSKLKYARAAELMRSVTEGEKGEIDTAEFFALIIYILKLPNFPKTDISKPLSSISLWKYLNIGYCGRCNIKFKRGEYHIIAIKERISLSLSSKILNGLINYFMECEDSRGLKIPTTIGSVKYLNG